VSTELGRDRVPGLKNDVAEMYDYQGYLHSQKPFIGQRIVLMAQKTAVSAGAIILREIDGELKVALAQHQRGEKIWVLPKGRVEQGETLEQAALREVREETGLANVQLIKPLGTVVRRGQKNNEKALKVIHYYLAYAPQSNRFELPTDESFTEVGWFLPEQVMDVLIYEEERDFLREHLESLLKFS
jgi:8-oxo-dGTP pyrophosphatase MutT (NUDIX family)